MADLIPTIKEGLWVRRPFRYSGHEFTAGEQFKVEVGERKIRNLYQSRFLMSTAEKVEEDKKRSENAKREDDAAKARKKAADETKKNKPGSKPDAIAAAQEAARQRAGQ